MTVTGDALQLRYRTQKWGPLAAVSLAILMTGLDSVMLPVATISITDDLQAPVSGIQAAFTLFSLTAATTYLTGGKLGDIHGRKRIYRIGLVLYGLGVLTPILAPNIAILIAGWSILRGLGMGLLLPSGFGLILANYAGPRRALAFGFIGASAPFGALVGPLLMGWAATQLSWRVPFGLDLAIILTILILTKTIAESEQRPGAKLDWLGTALSALGIGLLILGPTLASQNQAIGPFQVLAISGSGIIALFLLLVRNRHLAAQGGDPLFRLDIYKNRQFATGWASLFLLFFQLGAIILVVPIFLQTSAGFGILQSAYAMTPMFVGEVLSGTASGWLIQHLTNRRMMQLVLTVILLGLGWFQFVVGPAVSVGQLLLPMFVIGLGFGAGLAQVPNIALSAVRVDERGEATGLNTTAQDLGVGFGAGVVGSLLLSPILGGDGITAGMITLLAVAILTFLVVSFLPPDADEQ
jgi:MFS family permease